MAAAGLPMHLDGARLWNAAVASGTTVAERAASATTVTCCVSKGLGAPVGSLLAGPADLVAQARVERKRLGGGMRQVGILAAAGLLALDRVDRLADDHERARRLAKAAAARWPGGVDVALVHTNIVRITVGDPRPGARPPARSTVCSRCPAAPTPCGSSPTPTSTTPTSTGRSRRSESAP